MPDSLKVKKIILEQYAREDEINITHVENLMVNIVIL